MKKRFTEEQIVRILEEADRVGNVRETCRKYNVTEQTYYRWRNKYGGLSVSELRRLKQLEAENRRLRQLVADLSLDKTILQEALKKKL